MTKNNIHDIKSFEDFKQEKIRLRYELKLTEKKLQIKRLEIMDALHPANFINTILTELFTPLFKNLGKAILSLFKKHEKPESKDSEKEKG